MKRSDHLRQIINDMKQMDAIEFLLQILDRDDEALSLDDLGISLTNTEHKLFSYLVASEGKTVTKDQLYDALYTMRASGELPIPKVVDVYVSRLRKVLRNTDYVIETMHGRGYRLTQTSETSDCGADKTQTPHTSLKLSGSHRHRSFQE